MAHAPLGESLIPWMMGSHRQWEAQNSGHAYYWNTRYPLAALLPMAAQVAAITPLVSSELETPTLIFWHPDDGTVDAPLIRSVFDRIPAKSKQLITVDETGDDRHHVLAGDILSPDTNAVVIDGIMDFVMGLP
jgi:hypothetical protein